MGKISIKKIPLKVKDIGKLKEIVSSELEKCKDSQIYLENSLFKEIRYNYYDYDMSPDIENDERHYGKDMQNLYELLNAKTKKVEGTIGFIANTNDYVQVTKFRYNNLEYVHYLSKMGKVIIIYEDNEN